MIFIVGPTATGKTQTGIELAKKINGEIISADSRQIYKYLSIGTSKPSGKWTNLNHKKMYIVDTIPYHLVDFLDPEKNFSAGEFVELSKKIIQEIKKRGKVPIVVGGTGLYINSLINGIAKLPPRNNSIRKKLLDIEKKFGRIY
ncbi:MAG: tRNA (adenosine(37)-N6)-dimethylallyltransferase, partial [Endomicrobiia bacterium]